MKLEIAQYNKPEFRNPDNYGPQKNMVVELARKIKSVDELIPHPIMGGGGQVCILSPSGEFAYSLEEVFGYCLDIKKRRGEYQFQDGSILMKILKSGKVSVLAYRSADETPLLSVRKKIKLTQSQMAKLIGTSQHRISEIERRKNGRTETIKMLHHLEALEVAYEAEKLDELLKRLDS